MRRTNTNKTTITTALVWIHGALQTNDVFGWGQEKHVEQTTIEKCHKIVKNVNIPEFSDFIWNHHEKCI